MKAGVFQRVKSQNLDMIYKHPVNSFVILLLIKLIMKWS